MCAVEGTRINSSASITQKISWLNIMVNILDVNWVQIEFSWIGDLLIGFQCWDLRLEEDFIGWVVFGKVLEDQRNLGGWVVCCEGLGQKFRGICFIWIMWNVEYFMENEMFLWI